MKTENKQIIPFSPFPCAIDTERNLGKGTFLVGAGVGGYALLAGAVLHSFPIVGTVVGIALMIFGILYMYHHDKIRESSKSLPPKATLNPIFSSHKSDQRADLPSSSQKSSLMNRVSKSMLLAASFGLSVWALYSLSKTASPLSSTTTLKNPPSIPSNQSHPQDLLTNYSLPLQLIQNFSNIQNHKNNNIFQDEENRQKLSPWMTKSKPIYYFNQTTTPVHEEQPSLLNPSWNSFMNNAISAFGWIGLACIQLKWNDWIQNRYTDTQSTSLVPRTPSTTGTLMIHAARTVMRFQPGWEYLQKWLFNSPPPSAFPAHRLVPPPSPSKTMPNPPIPPSPRMTLNHQETARPFPPDFHPPSASREGSFIPLNVFPEEPPDARNPFKTLSRVRRSEDSDSENSDDELPLNPIEILNAFAPPRNPPTDEEVAMNELRHLRPPALYIPRNPLLQPRAPEPNMEQQVRTDLERTERGERTVLQEVANLLTTRNDLLRRLGLEPRERRPVTEEPPPQLDPISRDLYRLRQERENLKREIASLQDEIDAV